MKVQATRGLLAAVVVALLVGTVALATPQRTKGIYAGVITVGRGAAGIRLGMTRAQVVARLGLPLKDIRNVSMEYANIGQGKLNPKVRHGMFDVSLKDGRVRMFAISPNGGWRLADGNHVFTRGAIARLMHHYGRRLKPTRIEDGERLYRITERYLGRTVWTEFYVVHFGSKESVYGVDLLFPLGG